MLISSLIRNLRRRGTENSQNIQPRTVYTVQLGDVANGSGLAISTKRMGRSTENAVVAKQRSAACVMESGTAQRIAQRTKKRIACLKQQKKKVGSDATAVGLWSSWKKAAITWLVAAQQSFVWYVASSGSHVIVLGSLMKQSRQIDWITCKFRKTWKETRVLKNDLADYEGHARLMTITRRSTSVGAKSELMRNSLVGFKGWSLTVKMKKIT
jgi:hypothetical protein